MGQPLIEVGCKEDRVREEFAERLDEEQLVIDIAPEDADGANAPSAS